MCWKHLELLDQNLLTIVDAILNIIGRRKAEGRDILALTQHCDCYELEPTDQKRDQRWSSLIPRALSYT